MTPYLNFKSTCKSHASSCLIHPDHTRDWDSEGVEQAHTGREVPDDESRGDRGGGEKGATS